MHPGNISASLFSCAQNHSHIPLTTDPQFRLCLGQTPCQDKAQPQPPAPQDIQWEQVLPTMEVCKGHSPRDMLRCQHTVLSSTELLGSFRSHLSPQWQLPAFASQHNLRRALEWTLHCSLMKRKAAVDTQEGSQRWHPPSFDCASTAPRQQAEFGWIPTARLLSGSI